MPFKLFRKRAPAVEFAQPAPECVLEVVGDVHGCADLLRSLPPVATDAKRILVGDLVDRGPDSRGALELAYEKCTENEWICLKGNHEEMFLEFLRDPGSGRRWLRHGGLQTLASFGIGGVTETADEQSLHTAADRLRDLMPTDLYRWLEALPCIFTSGTVTVVHAALDPVLPLVAQSEGAMLWGHPDFRKIPRPDMHWVVHGHTIVDMPMIRNGVVSLDTGAYATGRLTLARFDRSGEISFEFAKPSMR